MTFRVRIDWAEGDTMYVANVKQPALLTENPAHARRVHNRANANQYQAEWIETIALLGLEGNVSIEDFEAPVK